MTNPPHRTLATIFKFDPYTLFPSHLEPVPSAMGPEKPSPAPTPSPNLPGAEHGALPETPAHPYSGIPSSPPFVTFLIFSSLPHPLPHPFSSSPFFTYSPTLPNHTLSPPSAHHHSTQYPLIRDTPPPYDDPILTPSNFGVLPNPTTCEPHPDMMPPFGSDPNLSTPPTLTSP